jgi:hypothetical protein
MLSGYVLNGTKAAPADALNGAEEVAGLPAVIPETEPTATSILSATG